MSDAPTPVVFGPQGRRITSLAASPSGEFVAVHHMPHNYNTADYHWLFFRRSGCTYDEVGELAGKLFRHDVAPLDDGSCLVLETDQGGVQLARYKASASGMIEDARWKLGGVSSIDATLRLLPSGREALVLFTDRDDKQVDWGGGPPPDFIQTWLRVNVATGEILNRDSETRLGEPPISRELYGGSRGVSVLAALGARTWVGARGDLGALKEIILALPYPERALSAGRTRLLTRTSAIDIASRETVLRLDRDPNAERFESQPGFHDLSEDERYAISTVAGGHFALWNIPERTAWRPDLPAHGGVQTAIFLPGRRVALGTKEGGVIVVDCAEGIDPADAAW